MIAAVVAHEVPIPGSFLADCLTSWRNGESDALCRQLSAATIQTHAPSDNLLRSRHESSKGAAVLKEFLSLLLDPERDLCLNRLLARFPNCVHALVVRAEIAMAQGLSCPAIQSNTLPLKANLVEQPPEADTSEWARLHTDIVTRAVHVAHGPSFVNLSHDRSCNLTCPSCRTKLLVAKPSEQEKLDIVRDRVVLPALKTATGVLITGSGDPFGSKHFRDVLDHLNPTDFPNLQVNLQTNGQLFTEREWDRLTGLHSMIRQVYISIDAATEATYGDIRRGGSFAKLCATMSFISGLRQSGRITQLVIAFVVQACNFRQMPAFVDLGREWRVDRISFSRLRQWGTYPADEFRRRDVCSAEHPEHADLLDVLRSPVFRENFIWLGNIGSFRLNAVDPAVTIGNVPNTPDSLDF